MDENNNFNSADYGYSDAQQNVVQEPVNYGQNYTPNYNQTYSYGGPQMTPQDAPMTMGEWVITLIVGMIPCIGIIMLFVWAFGNGNVNRKNYCRAQLIITLVAIVLSVIFSGAIMGIIGSMAYSMY